MANLNRRRQSEVQAADAVSTYAPPRVGCAGNLGGIHLWKNAVDVSPSITVQSGSQWWIYQTTLYRWTGTGWVFFAKAAYHEAQLSGFDPTNVTVGGSDNATPIGDSIFIPGITGYYSPVVQYWYWTSTGWHTATENTAYFTQFSPYYVGGLASSTCKAWQDPNGRF